MKKLFMLAGLVVGLAMVSACSKLGPTPLVFSDATTMGIGIGTGANGAPELTLGYKAASIAIVPVEANAGGEGGAVMGGEVPGPNGTAKDAFSVLGQFEGSADARATAAGLNRFFATGLAAQKLSDGFACAVSEGGDGRCTGTAAAALAAN